MKVFGFIQYPPKKSPLWPFLPQALKNEKKTYKVSHTTLVRNMISDDNRGDVMTTRQRKILSSYFILPGYRLSKEMFLPRGAVYHTER